LQIADRRLARQLLTKTHRLKNGGLGIELLALAIVLWVNVLTGPGCAIFVIGEWEMRSLLLESANEIVDQLLERLCLQLAITDTQHTRATSAYETIGAWIAAEDSPLATYKPVVSPQGSIPLGTTVRPRASEEFDADGVCLLNASQFILTPQQAYDLVLARIKENKTYADKINPQDRCIRVDYEGQLHLDVIPAVPASDPNYPTRILIPTHDRRNWQSTNPKGYQHWFRARQAIRTAKTLTLMEKRAEVEPMPENPDPEAKTPLQRIAQLFKRRRDVYFDGDKSSPKSILLTTIAGINYAGQQLATDGTLHILQELLHHAQGTNEVPKVWNPSNPGENLARHWQEDGRNYLAFRTFAKDFLDRMQHLLLQRGTAQIATALQELFDPTDSGIVKNAVAKFTEDIQQERQTGNIKLGTTGLTTAVASKAIPATKFYGSH
jgi:hypothetical protein